MGRFIVLGASGMLGQQLVELARRSELETIAVGRSGAHSLNYKGGDIENFASELRLTAEDTLVNCIGWIPQKSSGDVSEDFQLAYLLNSELVEAISNIHSKIGFSWIQILTDCVFDGRLGGYSETSDKDAKDLYGRSKVSGEKRMLGAIGIRCSIVGPDVNTHAGIYSWFKHEGQSGKAVKGYVNALWNGVSTLAFSRLCIGIHFERGLDQGTYHWVPADVTTKFELLQDFATNLGFSGLNIEPAFLPVKVDRTLATLRPELSESLWRLAGYQATPKISDLCLEFIRRDLGGG